MNDGNIELKRDTQVVRIPSGETQTLPQGTAVVITQALGDSYTVVIATKPGLYRIASEDADALGKSMEKTAPPSEAGAVTKDMIWAQLKNCFDPEIPVNIVDLGLIYELELNEAAGGTRVEVKMTLTAQGCGMGPAIAADAKRKILHVPGVTEADVAVVWEPIWGPHLITEDGKRKLGMI
jgi:probable FeS assembly SUF system protein SufT